MLDDEVQIETGETPVLIDGDDDLAGEFPTVREAGAVAVRLPLVGQRSFELRALCCGQKQREIPGIGPLSLLLLELRTDTGDLTLHIGQINPIVGALLPQN